MVISANGAFRIHTPSKRLPASPQVQKGGRGGRRRPLSRSLHNSSIIHHQFIFLFTKINSYPWNFFHPCTHAVLPEGHFYFWSPIEAYRTKYNFERVKYISKALGTTTYFFLAHKKIINVKKNYLKIYNFHFCSVVKSCWGRRSLTTHDATQHHTNQQDVAY